MFSLPLLAAVSASRASASLFDPLTLSPLQWLDAADSASLYDATSGGGLVAADGGVARWVDKGTGGKDGSEGTSLARPLRRVAVYNGRDVLEFNGSNSVMEHGLSVTGACTIYLVAKSTAAGVTRVLYSAADAHASLIAYVEACHGGGNYWGTYFNAFVSSSVDISSGLQVLTMVVRSGSDLDLVSNDLVETKVGSGYYGGDSLNRKAIGGSGAGDYFQGYLGEILVYGSAHDSMDQASIRSGYLYPKWGITP
jgi:hypothetical protein